MQGLDLKGTDVELSLLEVIIETGCFGNLSQVPLPIPNSCSASKDGAGRSAGPMRHSLTVPTISFNGSVRVVLPLTQLQASPPCPIQTDVQNAWF